MMLETYGNPKVGDRHCLNLPSVIVCFDYLLAGAAAIVDRRIEGPGFDASIRTEYVPYAGLNRCDDSQVVDQAGRRSRRYHVEQHELVKTEWIA
jgi:hypothetical protein